MKKKITNKIVETLTGGKQFVLEQEWKLNKREMWKVELNIINPSSLLTFRCSEFETISIKCPICLTCLIKRKFLRIKIKNWNTQN